jgi:RimJ/RimL family protein N-acetyltransferase
MRLVPFQKGDRARYEALVFNEEAMRRNYGRTFTKAEAELLFSAMLEANAEDSVTGFYKVFVPAAHCETYIGMGALNVNDDGVFEIEYMLLPEYWNRGYGTALVETLLSMAKASGLCRTVEAITDPDNLYSKRILVHAGFALVKQFVNDDGEPAQLYRKEL